MLANSQASASVTMISALVIGCGLLPTASARDRDQQYRHHDPVRTSSRRGWRHSPRMLADHPRFAGPSSGTGEKEDGRGDVERAHRRKRPAAASKSIATGKPIISNARNSEEARRARSCCRWSRGFAMAAERNESGAARPVKGFSCPGCG